MANYVDYCYSSDSSDGDYSGKPECLDFSYVAMDCDTLATNLHHIVGESKVSADYYESLIARHCQIGAVPDVVAVFHNLKMLDVSGNGLTKLPESLACLQRLACLVAKNNRIEDAGLLKNLELCKGLREVNLSGNCLVAFPPQLLQLPNLKFLFMGGNRISQIPREIKKLEKYSVCFIVFTVSARLSLVVLLFFQIARLVLGRELPDGNPRRNGLVEITAGSGIVRKHAEQPAGHDCAAEEAAFPTPAQESPHNSPSTDCHIERTDGGNLKTRLDVEASQIFLRNPFFITVDIER